MLRTAAHLSDSMSLEYEVVFDPVRRVWSRKEQWNLHFPEKSVGAVFLQQLRSVLDPSMLVECHYDSGIQRTAKDIYREAVTVASNMRRIGITKGDTVVLYTDANHRITPLTFGSILIGAAVAFPGPWKTDDDLDYALSVLQPTCILHEDSFGSGLQASLQRAPQKTLRCMLSMDATAAPNVDTELFAAIKECELAQFEAVQIEDPAQTVAVLKFTSGTTQRPKVVMLSHRTILASVQVPATWSPKQMPDMTMLTVSPTSWISQVVTMFFAVLHGVKRYIVRDVAKNLRHAIREGGVTHFFGPPNVLQRLCAETTPENITDLDSVRVIQTGGEPFRQQILALVHRAARNAQLTWAYGMTEFAGSVTQDVNGSSSKLAIGVQLKILDEQLRAVGPNVCGQIAVKPPVPMLGYRGIDNGPYFTSDGFFLTGDYGSVNDNYYVNIFGRVSDLLRCRNLTLIPNLVEEIVCTCLDVRQCCLVAHKKNPDDAEQIGLLFVTLWPNVTASPANVSEKIRSLLASALTPEQCNAIEDIYYVDQIPLTLTGKVLRRQLIARAIELRNTT